MHCIHCLVHCFRTPPTHTQGSGEPHPLLRTCISLSNDWHSPHCLPLLCRPVGEGGDRPLTLALFPVYLHVYMTLHSITVCTVCYHWYWGSSHGIINVVRTPPTPPPPSSLIPSLPLPSLSLPSTPSSPLPSSHHLPMGSMATFSIAPPMDTLKTKSVREAVD